MNRLTMRTVLMVFAAAATAMAQQASAPARVGRRPAAPGPAVGGCPAFPADNVWNTPVDKLAPHPQSDLLVNTIGADKPLHPDFGSGLYNGVPIGIPFNLIPGNQRHVPIKFDYRDESDLSNYPIPDNVAIEGGPDSTGDSHILLFDKDKCVLWEVFAAKRLADGTWQAGSGAVFDLTCNCMRPDGWTSADAAGLPIFPGLVRYDEVAAGEIRHALRFTAPQTLNGAVWPARHVASKLTGNQYPPMGQRFRLKASVDISSYPPDAQVVLRALKKYGMILADNGSSWFVSGAPDERWNNGALGELKRIKGSDFEAVDGFDLFVALNSARAQEPQ